MNSHQIKDNRQLDRLVDGELSDDEYRSVLAALDKTPDGWRRCAMAFLEAQAWRQELGELRTEILSPRDEATCQLARRRDRNWSTRQIVGLTLAMAASFVVAFASGVWWNGGNSFDPQPGLSPVARQEGDPRPATREETPFNAADREPATDRVPPSHLTFVVDRGNGESDRFELPIYDANDRVARQLLQDSPALPADVERAIRDSGFQVKRLRQWTPVQLRDGRRAFFPVDQLDITPVSGSIYH